MSLCAVALLVVLLSACGGDDGASAADATSTGAAGSARTATVSSASTSVAGSDGGSATARSANPGTGACGLLTNDEISAATGTDVAGVDAFPAPTAVVQWTGICTWNLAPEDDYKTVTLTYYGAEKHLDTSEIAANAEQIAGLGDDAYYDPALSALLVQTGDQFFALQVIVSDGDPDADLAIAQQLAPKILERLAAP